MLYTRIQINLKEVFFSLTWHSLKFIGFMNMLTDPVHLNQIKSEVVNNGLEFMRWSSYLAVLKNL